MIKNSVGTCQFMSQLNEIQSDEMDITDVDVQMCYICKKNCQKGNAYRAHMRRHTKDEIIRAFLPDTDFKFEDEELPPGKNKIIKTDIVKLEEKMVKCEVCPIAEVKIRKRKTPLKLRIDEVEGTVFQPKKRAQDDDFESKAPTDEEVKIKQNYECSLACQGTILTTPTKTKPTNFKSYSDGSTEYEYQGRKFSYDNSKRQYFCNRKQLFERLNNTPKRTMYSNGQNYRFFSKTLYDDIENLDPTCHWDNPGKYLEGDTKFVKTFVCQYCTKEFLSRETINSHVGDHLKDSVINDLLFLEQKYTNNRHKINTLFHFYRAGFLQGRTSTYQAHCDSIDFYKVFLEKMTEIEANVPLNYYYCDLCKMKYLNAEIFHAHVLEMH